MWTSSATVLLLMLIQDMGLTSLVLCLEMELGGGMQELHPKLNFISKQWRMTTVGISNGQVSTICSTLLTITVLELTQTLGAQSQARTGVFTLHHQRMWMIGLGTTTNFTVVEKV